LPALEHSTPTNLIFFVREHTSLELCEKPFEEQGVSVLLDKDTAFWANRSDLESLVGSAEKRYRLYALRDDNEDAGEMVNDFGKGVCLDPAYFCGSFEHWLRVHLFAEQIITSRTHSSILGAILEKPVILYPSKYHKNRSIWDYNLKYMGVVWGPEQQKPIFMQTPTIKWLPKWITGSYKVNQILRWLQRVPLS
jgi:exopolysaccharide biosynthesis predicted pyruvyltransferase EpsI